MIAAFAAALPHDPGYRRGLAIVAAFLVLVVVVAWTAALVAFEGQPVQLGVAVVMFGLGLRHALDADHIAAIDNVTRKLVQERRPSASTGFWFAIGHSAVVLLATAVVLAAAGQISGLATLRNVGGFLSAGFSGVFLLVVAGMNTCILLTIVRAIRRARAGQAVKQAELDDLLAGAGFLARLFRPLFRFVTRPWQMAALGFVFGLSFDTASEVSLFSISAAQAAHGGSLASALVYPVLFAAGMSLLDTADGVMMVGAYGWAAADPLRKLRYNLIITTMSVVVALFVGLLDLSALASRCFQFRGGFAGAIALLGSRSDLLGVVIVGLFAVAWAVSLVIFRSSRRS